MGTALVTSVSQAMDSMRPLGDQACFGTRRSRRRAGKPWFMSSRDVSRLILCATWISALGTDAKTGAMEATRGTW